MRAPEIKKGRRAAPQTVSARLSDHVTLEARANGQIVANFDGFSVELGAFSASVVDRAQDVSIALQLV